MDRAHPAVAAWLASASVDGAPDAVPSEREAFRSVQLRRRTAEAALAEIRVEVLQNRLIPRELVRRNVMSYLDLLSRELFTDCATTLAARLGNSTLTREERVTIAREMFSSSIQRAKAGAIRALDHIIATMYPPPERDDPSDQPDPESSPARPRRAPRRARRVAPRT